MGQYICWPDYGCHDSRGWQSAAAECPKKCTGVSQPAARCQRPGEDAAKAEWSTEFRSGQRRTKKQIAEDTEKLLKLATDLKTEIDKTNKDTLSLVAVRKAGEIEKLARNIKDQMKLTLRSN